MQLWSTTKNALLENIKECDSIKFLITEQISVKKLELIGVHFVTNTMQILSRTRNVLLNKIKGI